MAAKNPPQAQARKLNAGPLKPGDQVPVLYRSFEIAAGSVNADDRTVEICFATEVPVERYFGREILECKSGAVRLARLNSGGALLREHNRDEQIGVHVPGSARVDGDGKCRAVVKFSRSTLGEQEFQDVKDGIRSLVSVGYLIHKMVLVSEDDENGSTYRCTDWEPLENSIVSVPVDTACGVGRSAGPDAELTIPQITKAGSPPPHPTSTTMTEQEQKDKDANEKRAKDQATADARAAVEKDVRAQLLSDQNKITELGEKFAEFGGAAKAKDAIKRGISPQEFQDELLKSFDGKPVRTAPSEGQRIEVVEDRALTIGAQFVRSPQYQAGVKKSAQGERVASMEVDIAVLGIRGKVEMAKRAGFTSSDLAPVNVQIQTGVIGLGVQRLTIMDLIAPGRTGAASIIYPRENTFGTVDGTAVAAGAMPRAKSVGERGVKPLWEPDLTTETAPVKKIAIVTKVPDEFMSDFPASQSFIDERLPFMVDTETEYQLLYGDGLGNNLKGITTVTGVQTRAITTTDDSTKAGSLLQGLTDIRVNSFFEPDGYAFHPYDWETAQLLKDTAGRFLAGGPYYIPYTGGVFMELHTFWGKPVAVSTAVTYGKPLAGAWKLGAQYFLREGMRLEMTNANEDDFRRNLIAIRAEHRLALAVYRPVAFLEFTGFPTRA